MNYPVWELESFGGGSLIALIAVPHVYIAHLAVGGGLFLWLTDLLGWRRGDPGLHAYVKKHLRFFMLLTMVFGGISGVGIWFIIALVHPGATSALIHSFVFGWAIEWVFFVGEIVALLVYYYRFDALTRSSRLTVAFLYALFAWGSLFVINGILCFMLTPGQWLETGRFWDGFFNPTFFPALFFRTFAALMFAGLFGYVTTVFLPDSDARTRMIAYCSKWLYLPVFGLVPSGIWYYRALPEEVRAASFGLNPEIVPYLQLFIVASVLLFLFGVLLSLRSGLTVQRVITFALVLIGQGWMGGYEYMREIARKPFVISGYMYSTGILVSEVERLNQKGILPQAKWTAVREVTPENQVQAGRELFNLQCLSCHTIGGHNDIVERTKGFTRRGLVALLTGQGRSSPFMPPFAGTQAEKEALAAYILEELHHTSSRQEEREYRPPALAGQQPPPFDPDEDEYVLLVWNDLGMHCISDCDSWFVVLPPANSLEAQLIRRGPRPELIGAEAEISYQVETGFEDPASQVPFWEHSESIFGAKLERNVGLAGNGLSGTFEYDEGTHSFAAHFIPVVPYRSDGVYNPYPLFSVEARDRATGDLLARTLVVAPTSTEMGCRNCHGGGWRWRGISGVSDETAVNILARHDRLSGTRLLEEAKAGRPRLCQSCHADPALNSPGDPKRLNMSAAVHGFHANYIDEKGAAACVLCHPSRPGGNTLCLRGVHAGLGVDCVRCHGSLHDHALALLRKERGKAEAGRLSARLRPVSVESGSDVEPRTPWLQEPDCLNCHIRFEPPSKRSSGFNRWVSGPDQLYRKRTDNMGVRCEACHGSPHALYPAVNPYSPQRDNLQPLQYSGMPYPLGSNASCPVCHAQEMPYSGHHRNQVHPFRNAVGRR